MAENNRQFTARAKWLVIFGDLVAMNVVFWTMHLVLRFTGRLPLSGNILWLDFILCVTLLVAMARRDMAFYVRGSRPESVFFSVSKCAFTFTSYAVFVLVLLKTGISSSRWLLFFFLMCYVSFFVVHMLGRYLVRSYRRHGGDRRDIVFLGCSDSIKSLNKFFCSELSAGSRVVGYFDDIEDEDFSKVCTYLGTCDAVIPYMEENKPSNVLCGLPRAMNSKAKEIATWCQKNVVLFSSVPTIHNYFNQRVYPELVGGVPVYSFQKDPLSDPFNAFVKRAFDVLFSGLFLCTIFPFVYIFVAIGTKISSPGPVFFKQKRTGMNGEDFYMYKFRSMKVNDDSDTLQATKDDPRKTRFGDFLRRTSIDELPQFINVFVGDMSMVGPRPHMVRQTDEYSALIDKYMVRHFVKPGITGWAQVTGFRGETKELSQMEGRVAADIWYIENWSIAIDALIVIKTILQVFIKGDEQAY